MTFKIPERAVQDPEVLDCIVTMVKDLLTSQRSNIKQKVGHQHSGCELLIDRYHAKLANSMKSQSHISLLARTLAPGGHFEITLSHWAWYAFLVHMHVNQLNDCLFPSVPLSNQH